VRLVKGLYAFSPSLPGLWRASIAIGRPLLLMAALASLAAVRLDVPLYIYIIAVAVSLAAVHVLVQRGSDFRPWALYILAFVLFAHLRTLADETGNPARYGYVISLERALFLGTVPTLWLQKQLYTFGRATILDLYSLAIYLTYFFAPHITALALWRLNPARFRPYIAALLGALYLGLAVAFIVPTAPPWLAGQRGDLPHVFRILRDILGRANPEAYEQGYAIAGTNPVAAMPSLHMAVTFIILFTAWGCHPLAAAGALLYTLSMGFALVYLGEHYVVDLLAGLLTALIAWSLAHRWGRQGEALQGVGVRAAAAPPAWPGRCPGHRGG